MRSRRRREPDKVAQWGMVLVFIAMGVAAYFKEADAATHLPVVCATASAAGRPINDCAAGAQSIDIPSPASLVRACSVPSCTYSERRWRSLSSVPADQFVEVCTVDKSPGSPISGGSCAQDGGTWNAMRMVPASQVMTAQEPPDPAADEPGTLPGSFAVTPNRGTSPATATITWNVPSTCGNLQASGSWTGAKAQSGSQQVTNVTASAAYTLTCQTPGTPAGSAVLEWTDPTQNKDGTPLTNLAGFYINHGAARPLSQQIQLPHGSYTPLPGGRSRYEVKDLPAGPRYFTVSAYTATRVTSDPSNEVSKTISAATQGQTLTSTRRLTVDPAPPNPPTGLTVIETTAYRLNQSTRNVLKVVRTGTVSLGVKCDEDQHAMGLNRIDRAAVIVDAGQSRPNVALAKCAPVL